MLQDIVDDDSMIFLNFSSTCNFDLLEALFDPWTLLFDVKPLSDMKEVLFSSRIAENDFQTLRDWTSRVETQVNQASCYA